MNSLSTQEILAAMVGWRKEASYLTTASEAYHTAQSSLRVKVPGCISACRKPRRYWKRILQSSSIVLLLVSIIETRTCRLADGAATITELPQLLQGCTNSTYPKLLFHH